MSDDTKPTLFTRALNAPSNPDVGDTWIDSSDPEKVVPKVWSGSAWVTSAIVFIWEDWEGRRWLSFHGGKIRLEVLAQLGDLVDACEDLTDMVHGAFDPDRYNAAEATLATFKAGMVRP